MHHSSTMSYWYLIYGQEKLYDCCISLLISAWLHYHCWWGSVIQIKIFCLFVSDFSMYYDFFFLMWSCKNMNNFLHVVLVLLFSVQHFVFYFKHPFLLSLMYLDDRSSVSLQIPLSGYWILYRICRNWYQHNMAKEVIDYVTMGNRSHYMGLSHHCQVIIYCNLIFRDNFLYNPAPGYHIMYVVSII